MKIKPLYIYLILAVFIVVGIVITNYLSQDTPQKPSDLSTNQMPNDDVHKNLPNDDIHNGMGGKGPGDPSKDNVKEEFWKTLNSLREEVKKNPSDTVKAFQLANYLSSAHNPSEAIDLYNSILKRNPKRIDVLMRLGLVYFQQHDYDKCENVTKKIISYDPNNSQAIYNLGAIKDTQGKNDEAKKIWNELIKKFPNTEAAEFAKSSIANLK